MTGSRSIPAAGDKRVRERRFSEPALQQIYDRLRRDPPAVESHKAFAGRGGISSAYVRGYTHPTLPPGYMRNSQAYAGWAAGVDNARTMLCGRSTASEGTLEAEVAGASDTPRLVVKECIRVPKRGDPTTFVVEGRGEFPIDMLRREGSYPSSKEDQRKIDASLDPGQRPRDDAGRRAAVRVSLIGPAFQSPITERWESFGWRVVACDHDRVRLSAPRAGRPRVHPISATASDRVTASLRQLEADGGARRTFRLSPQAVTDLAAIRDNGGGDSDTAVVERLIAEEAERLRLRISRVT